MKKILKFAAYTVALIGSLIMLAVTVLIVTVVGGLLLDEHTKVEDVPAQVEITSKSYTENSQGAIGWEQGGNFGTVFFILDDSNDFEYSGTFPEGKESEVKDAARKIVEEAGSKGIQ